MYKVIFATNSDNGPDPLCGKEEHEHTYTERKGNWWNGYKYKGGCYPQDTFSNSRICGKDEHTHTHGGLFQDSCYGTIYKELTIEAKYGASIGNKWPTKNGSSTWAVERNGNTYQANIDTMPLGGATFYGPKAGKNSETAYYYVEVLPGETGTVGPNKEYKQHHIDTTPGRNLEVTKEDRYDITGFKLNDSLSTSIGAKYNGAKFYYTRNSYKIVFMNNGQEKTVSRKYEQSIANDSYTPTAPEGKEGYKFAGWYDNELCEGKEYTFTGKTMPAQNITLYAKWEEPVHTVTVYDIDRTKVLKTFENVSHGSTIDVKKMPANYTLPDGYEFLGWVLLEDGTPFNFNTQITRDYKLYAKIGSTATYTVTYDENGGSGTMADTAKYAEGATASVMANGFTAPSGKVFLGWSTNKDGPVAYYANSQLKIEKQNVILYAIWGYKDSTVTLTYNANYEGANPATNTTNSIIKNNENVTLAQFTALFPTRVGYQFTGWNTQANGKGVAFKAGDKARVDKNGDNVLYAQWEQLTGSLTITKKVEGLTGTSAPTEFKFTVTGPNNYSKDVTVSANGSLPLTGLPVGEYTVKEKPTDIPGYTLNTTYKTDAATAEPTTEKATVTVTANTDATVTVTNTYTKDTTSVTVTKEWNDNLVKALRPESVTVQLMKNGVPVDGALVVLDDNNQWSHTWTDLPMYNDTGSKITYSVKEVNVPAGYTVAVNPVATAATPTFTITNTANVVEAPEIVPASLTVIKKDADNGALLKGAKFTLIPEGGKATDAAFAETDENGKAVFTDLAKGTYTLKEITAPAGYQATDKTWTITVSDDAKTAAYKLVNGKFVKTITCKVDDVENVVSNGTITITNAKNTGTLTISKMLKGDLVATDFGKPFTFTIWQGAKAVKSVEVWPGNPVTLTLDPGKYTIVEKNADVKDYDLTTEYDKETFTVEAGKNVTVTVTNTYTKKVTPPPAEYTLSVDIQKNIELKRSSSRKPGKASFTFEAYLVDEKGNETILDTVTIDTKGTKSADGTLTFTLTDNDLSVTGHGTVYVREVKGSTRGWTYDDTVYALGVELTTDGKLNIISVDTKRIDKPATLEFTNVYYKRSTTTGGGDKPIQSVKTGDMGIAMYAMTSLLSLGGAALVIKKRKEEK